jgi:hypothetical protein
LIDRMTALFRWSMDRRAPQGAIWGISLSVSAAVQGTTEGDFLTATPPVLPAWEGFPLIETLDAPDRRRHGRRRPALSSRARGCGADRLTSHGFGRAQRHFECAGRIGHDPGRGPVCRSGRAQSDAGRYPAARRRDHGDQGIAAAQTVILCLLGRPVPAWIALPGIGVTREIVVDRFQTIWRHPAPREVLRLLGLSRGA